MVNCLSIFMGPGKRRKFSTGSSAPLLAEQLDEKFIADSGSFRGGFALLWARWITLSKRENEVWT